MFSRMGQFVPSATFSMSSFLSRISSGLLQIELYLKTNHHIPGGLMLTGISVITCSVVTSGMSSISSYVVSTIGMTVEASIMSSAIPSKLKNSVTMKVLTYLWRRSKIYHFTILVNIHYFKSFKICRNSLSVNVSVF